MRLTWLICLIAGWVGTGCFDPKLAEKLRCGERDGCPPGFVCSADKICLRAGNVASCNNGAQDTDETGVDCGGACAGCSDGQGCAGPGDCLSGVCEEELCVTPVCGDGVVHASVEECDDGNRDDTDLCTSTCALAACGDGIRNADEMDVDCGGHCGARWCRSGQTCMNDSDCVSGTCTDNACAPAATVVTGSNHTCALLDSGKVRCWGRNDFGQLGLGHTNNIGDDELPASAGEVSLDSKAMEITAGRLHTCALLDTGAVRCWGRDSDGQLGLGEVSQLGYNPVASKDVDLGGQPAHVAAGGFHTCALLDTGKVRCWGLNESGQLGYGHTDAIGDNEAPAIAGDVDVGGVVVQLAAGGYHTCALLDSGKVRCWGLNESGQLGYGNTDTIGDNETPASADDVNVGGDVVQLAAGWQHTCALLKTGVVRCWGFNESGQLGYGHASNIGDDDSPALAGDVALSGATTQLIAATHVTCALLATGVAYCWGYNASGELGRGHTHNIGDNELPQSGDAAGVGMPVDHLSVGHGSHICARVAGGGLRCWGHNEFGELGYGHTEPIGDDELPASAGDIGYQ